MFSSLSVPNALPYGHTASKNLWNDHVDTETPEQGCDEKRDTTEVKE